MCVESHVTLLHVTDIGCWTAGLMISRIDDPITLQEYYWLVGWLYAYQLLDYIYVIKASYLQEASLNL